MSTEWDPVTITMPKQGEQPMFRKSVIEFCDQVPTKTREFIGAFLMGFGTGIIFGVCVFAWMVAHLR